MGLIKCKDCGNMMSDKADICPHCGAPKDGSIFCSSCGKVIREDANFCPYCGARVQDNNLSMAGFIHCPDCNEVIRDDAVCCPNCGCPLKVDKSDVVPVVPKPPVQICNNCGAHFNAELFVCPNCGSPKKGYVLCPDCGAVVLEGKDICSRCGCPINKENSEDSNVAQDNLVENLNKEENENLSDKLSKKPQEPLENQKTSPNVSTDRSSQQILQIADSKKESDQVLEDEEPSISQNDKKQIPTNEPEISEKSVDETEKGSKKGRITLIIFSIGFILMIVFYFIFPKSSEQKSNSNLSHPTDSVVIDSMKIMKGSIIPLWLVGQWAGTFSDKSMGKFSILIIIDKSGNWTQMITPNGKRGISEMGKIVSYAPKVFKVLYVGDKSKTSFAVNENRKTFCLGKNYWLVRK